MTLSTLLRLDPGNPEGLRMRISLASKRGGGESLVETYQRLNSSSKLNLTELNDYARLAAFRGDTNLARELAAKVATDDPAAGSLLLARLAMIWNQPANAVARLRYYLTTHPGDPRDEEFKLALAEVLLSPAIAAVEPPAAGGAGEDPRKEALKLLRELKDRPVRYQAAALALALQSGVLPRSERPQWIEELRANPAASPPMLLVADRAAVELDPPSRERVAASLIARLKGAPLDQRIAGARALQGWFLSENSSPAFYGSGLISPEEALTSPDAFRCWMKALKIEGLWSNLLEALRLSGNPLPRPERDLELALATRETGGATQGEKMFAKILADYPGETPEFYDILAFLDSAGERGLFERNLGPLFSNPDKAKPAYREIVLRLKKFHDSRSHLRLLEFATSFDPLKSNIGLRNALSYQRLILGESVDEECLAYDVVLAPEQFSFRVTEALSLLHRGEGASALRFLEDLKGGVAPTRESSQSLIVYVAALIANGRTEEAEKLIPYIHTDILSLQETEFLNSTLKGDSASKLKIKSGTGPEGSVIPKASPKASPKSTPLPQHKKVPSGGNGSIRTASLARS